VPEVGRDPVINLNSLSDQGESAPSISNQGEHIVTLYFSLTLMSKGEKKVLSVCYSWRSKQNSAVFQGFHQCQRGRLFAGLQEECVCH
jgi:hypothetical protein